MNRANDRGIGRGRPPVGRLAYELKPVEVPLVPHRPEGHAVLPGRDARDGPLQGLVDLPVACGRHPDPIHGLPIQQDLEALAARAGGHTVAELEGAPGLRGDLECDGVAGVKEAEVEAAVSFKM